MLGLGAVFTLLPLMVRNGPLAKALSALVPVGLLLIAGGALLLWLARRPAAPPGLPSASGDRRPEVASHTPPSSSASASARTASAVRGGTANAPANWGPQVFEVIEWRRFEAVVERLFAQAGFETRSQSHGADGGVDVWLYSRHTPGKPVSVVQCKHWQGKRVGVDKIRELRGVMAAHDVKRGQFATTSTFTPEAEAFARENGINLLDIGRLLELVGKRTADQQRELLAVALEGEYWRPTCVNCGGKLVERTAREGGRPFWGCPNFPRCRTTMPMRVD